MNKQIRLIIGVIIFSAAAVAAVAYSVISDRVPLNESNIVGSLPGNIINGGYFCELDGTVYFANVDEAHALYSMKPDESDVKSLGSMGVSFICGSGRFLYFFMDSSQYSSGGKGLGYIGSTYGLYRYKIKGGKTKSLEHTRLRSMQLCGSYIYYSGVTDDGSGLFKQRIDGRDRVHISDDYIDPAAYDGNYIYYTGTTSPSLYSLNTSMRDSEARVFEGNISSPVCSNGIIYYIDNAQNYKLCRYNRTTGANDTIGDERVDFYNTDGRYIWYSVSSGDTPALKRMNMDGSDVQVIAEGVFNSINITSRYIYFSPYDAGGTANVMYHVPIDSLGPVSRFSPQTS